jgi:hypothetical protein
MTLCVTFINLLRDPESGCITLLVDWYFPVVLVGQPTITSEHVCKLTWTRRKIILCLVSINLHTFCNSFSGTLLADNHFWDVRTTVCSFLFSDVSPCIVIDSSCLRSFVPAWALHQNTQQCERKGVEWNYRKTIAGWDDVFMLFSVVLH